MNKGKHRRSRSTQLSGNDAWTETPQSRIVDAAIGAAKWLSPFSGGVSPQKKAPTSGSSFKYLTPSTPGYPKYANVVSTSEPAGIPLLQVFPVTMGGSVSIEVGPDEGLFECLDDISERKKVLKSLLKKVQQNPNALKEDDSPYFKYDLGFDDIKLKNTSLKEVERKLKPSLTASAIQRKERWAYSDPRISGKTTDTYAFDVIKGEKAGQPNCDSFYAEGFTKMLLFGVADGIGWGIPSRRASQAALLGFQNQLKSSITKKLQKLQTWDTVMIGEICIEALNTSHEFVNSNTEAKTTFAGGVIIELANQGRRSRSFDYCGSSDEEETSIIEAPKKKWALVAVSVGDTLVYRYSSRREKVTELTTSDRTFGVRDAGGSLGGSQPDYRNLSLHFCLLEEGDYVIAVSDGVHDNLDPEILKQRPIDIGLNETDWKEVPNDTKNNAKRKFKEEKLNQIIHHYPDTDISAKTIVNNVIEFIWNTTSDHRNAYEQGAQLQKDWDSLKPADREAEQARIQAALKDPAGKFDHVTCLCIKAATI